MARKKTASAQNDDDDVKPTGTGVEEFEEIPVEEDADTDDAAETNDDDDINALLNNPDKAAEIPTDDGEDKEEVMYCPNCGVTGLFVDNVCMNCGEKKGKKAFPGADDNEDSAMDFPEESMSMEEY